MRIEEHRDGQVVVLEPSGESDAHAKAPLGERLERMIEEGDRLFVLDLRMLKFIDSASLGRLIKTSQRLGSMDGQVVLARPSKFVRKTLSVLGLGDVFGMFDSVEAAVQHLRPQDAGG